MDSGSGRMIPEVINSAWVPATPAKPGLLAFEPICTTANENQAVEADWSGSHGISQDFHRALLEPVGFSQGFDSLNFSRENADGLSKMSYGNLLALAESSNAHKTFNSLFSSHTTDGSSGCSRTSFNLNFPPVGDVVGSSSFQFLPITPVANKGIEGTLNLNLNINEIQTPRDVEENVELQEKDKLSVLAKEPDKEGELDTELNKTLQQKPRRKKHRPKVVVEGKAGRRRNKPGPPNTPGTEEVKAGKRKYVRRKGVDKPAATPSDEGSNVINPVKMPTGSNEGPAPTPTDEGSNVIDLDKMPSCSNEIPKVGRMHPPANHRPAATHTDGGLNVIDLEEIPKETPKVGPPQEPAATARVEGSNVIDLEKIPNEKPKVGRRRPKRNQGPAACPIGINGTSKVIGKCPRRNQDHRSKKYPTEEGNSEATEEKAVPRPKRSCKRAIDFDFVDLDAYEDFSEPSSNFDSSHVQNICKRGESLSVVHLEQDQKGDAELTEVDITYELSNVMNGDSGKSLSQPGLACEEDNTLPEMERNFGSQYAASSQNTSSFISNAFLTEKAPVRGSKRQHSCLSEPELYNTSIGGAHWNSSQAYQSVVSVNRDSRGRFTGTHFPTIHTKKRSEKGHILATSCTENLKAEAYHMIHPYQFCDNRSLANNAANGPQSRNHHHALSIDMLRRKRSKVHTQVRDVASSHEICNQFLASSSREAITKQHMTMFHSSMGTLVADAHPTTATKKSSKRNSLNGHLPALTWRDISPIDEIAERIRYLNINDDYQGQYTASTSNAKFQRETALVLYQRDGTVAPFVEVKKRKPRPKVDLDDETARVWRLLLQDINSQGIDGTDEEKAKWWEEERRVFRGRADSFIARMRLVQGDRRFSPWKGSVVDSVVGVFLTQNVSDHLSSSAFMSLAARFPLKSNISTPLREERPNVTIDEPFFVMDPDETIASNEGPSNKATPGQDSMAFREMGWKEEVINSELTEDSFNLIRSTDNSKAKHFHSSEKDPDLYNGLTLDRPANWIDKEEASSHSSHTETDLVVSSQNSGVFSHNSADSSRAQAIDITETTSLCSTTSFVQLLQMAGTSMLHEVYHQENSSANMDVVNQDKDCSVGFQKNKEDDTGSLDTIVSCSTADYPLKVNIETPGASFFGPPQDDDKLPIHTGEQYAPEQSDSSTKSPNQSTNQKILPAENDKCCNSIQIEMNVRMNKDPTASSNLQTHTEESNCDLLLGQECPTSLKSRDITERASTVYSQSNSDGQNKHLDTVDRTSSKTSNGKGGRPRREKQDEVNWDILREQALESGKKRERTMNTLDSLDWEAVRCANVHEIAETIKERGMNNMLAERIQEFLNRLLKEHGSTDLEWLRDVPPDKAKEYLLSFRGLGLKSVECVRLLTLHHLAFPVDTNVGRIAVRLGWVPLQPLPESLQLHLLELYPILESIQKYLWPRLCKLDQGTLYELHYHMITFGKVFCTKSKPNCNACPMRGECRHFASAFASARLALPAPEGKSIVTACENKSGQQTPRDHINPLRLSLPESIPQSVVHYGGTNSQPIIEEPSTPEPIIEVPATPLPEQIPSEPDIEDAYNDDSNEIPTIDLNLIQFAQNVEMFVKNSMELNHVEMSKALVALTPEAASIPMPKLKNISRLRTEHHVYELPDSHPLLEGLENRDPDDPCSYLLAIWTPGETANSVQPPERRCNSQESGMLCHEVTCFACNSVRETESQTVRGTLLIPCRTAMRGSFPLNGTYFQVNEVFADHESSLNPIDVPRHWLWDLHRKTVFFGTSIPTIFKGLSTEDIQHCFWRGYVCVRGFDRKTRAPRPLMARLHFPASKLNKNKQTDET